MAQTRKHILLVDDEGEFLFSAAMALRVAGYIVTVARSGGEALEQVRASAESGNAIDLLVTDIQMKGMSGKDLIGAVRDEWPSLPVFVMTGFLDSDLGEMLAMEGCVGHLLKPFNPREFLDRIGGVVGAVSGEAARK